MKFDSRKDATGYVMRVGHVAWGQLAAAAGADKQSMKIIASFNFSADSII